MKLTNYKTLTGKFLKVLPNSLALTNSQNNLKPNTNTPSSRLQMKRGHVLKLIFLRAVQVNALAVLPLTCFTWFCAE